MRMRSLLPVPMYVHPTMCAGPPFLFAVAVALCWYCFRGVKSVYEFLKEKGGLAVLSDPDIENATREVLALGRPRPQITKDIRRKVCLLSFNASFRWCPLLLEDNFILRI